jgi:hypothetical protein
MHKSTTKCNETLGKWCKNKHGASKIIDTFETYQGGKLGPSPYTRSPPGGGDTHNWHEQELSSPPICASPPYLSPSHPPVWLLKGLRRSEGQIHRCTPSCCRNSESDPNQSTSTILVGSEIRRSSSFTVCVRVLWGASTCGTKLLHWCCRNIKIYKISRSATLASSSTLVREHNPRVYSTRVCHRIPVNRYTLLIDRSWAFGFCIAINFLFLASNPNSGIRAWSMRIMLVRLEHIVKCGHWSSHFYPHMCICLYLWHSWIKAIWTDFTHTLCETGSITGTRHAPYVWLADACFSNYSGYSICNRGPLTGIKRNNWPINGVASCSYVRNGYCAKALAAM